MANHMRPALHELEAARRALTGLFGGQEACCFLDWDEPAPCPNHEDPYEILELNPLYQTLDAVLEEAIEEARRPIRAQAARTNKDNNREPIWDVGPTMGHS